jgi:S-adenosylmethionine-dependent methyltransferase
VSDTDEFDEHLERWRSWASTPWGRIRFAVVRRTLSWQVDALGGGPLRVLDVGGGDARDSLPLAQRGHSVTVLDPAEGMLREARSAAERLGVTDRLRLVEGSLDDLEAAVGGDFDLVLCHFLMQYRPAGLTDLRRLSAALRRGGRLSLAAPNPAGVVLGRLVREGPAAALAELDRPTAETVTFQQTVRKIPYEDMREDLAAVGLDVVAQYGGRCANDLLVDDDAKHDPVFFADLERLELALCDREQFIRTAQFWQLVAEKPAGPAEAVPAAP